MFVRSTAIICSVRVHGETGAIVRVLTADAGLIAGYVRGGRSRRLRPVLSAGNKVMIDLRARAEDQLGAMTVELVQSRATLMAEPIAAAALDWVTALAAATLPERHGYPAIHSALDGVLIALESASVARDWVTGLIGYEQLLLAELGYRRAGMGMAPPYDWGDVMAALDRNGRCLATDLFAPRRADVLAARERLIMRLRRAAQ